MRIWHQSSVDLENYPHYHASMLRHYEKILHPDTQMTFVGVPVDTWGGLSPSDFIGSPYLYQQTLSNLLYTNCLRAEREGYDAFVIGSYTAPFLRECRSLVNIPVISMPESTILVGCSMAQKIGLVTLNDENRWFLQTMVSSNKFEGRIAGIEVVEPALNEKELEDAFADPTDYIARFTEVSRRVIAMGADVIVPAEGIVAEVVYKAGLTEIDGVCVMDGIGIPLAYAQMLGSLHRSTGLHAGRKWHYVSPGAEALARFPPLARG
ncbi:hypothetical protein H1W37_15640 [Stappia taiwanensis]|uniref:Hydantoin racemase n=1 Tax=Stappia taiwanensis TaxID=992267 RepID=A0A838Y1K2_9HYPH|nr:aspartate/glutamate racemase family protein [Stappia taiwanensis]MBA4613094.1 hypothetical protein [Stappia taiwanensis]GGF01282.1 hypothetical protein GCM10007285_31090 [Stappia taiwanensis]